MAWNVLEPTGTGDFSARDDAIRANFEAIETILGAAKLATPAALVAILGYIKVSDQQTQNTAGGTFTSGAWRQRTINTEDSDTGSNCSISSNEITLDAGTYICLIRCPAYDVALHQARLYDVTAAAVLLLGSVQRNASGGGNTSDSIIQGSFTLATAHALEIEHRCSTTNAGDGFGIAGNFTTEVYTVAEFWKIG
jgi:hypothetical protein